MKKTKTKPKRSNAVLRFSANVTHRLSFLEMTRSELASRLGVTPAKIAHILNGSGDNAEPRLSDVQAYADILEVEPWQLLAPTADVKRENVSMLRKCSQEMFDLHIKLEDAADQLEHGKPPKRTIRTAAGGYLRMGIICAKEGITCLNAC